MGKLFLFHKVDMKIVLKTRERKKEVEISKTERRALSAAHTTNKSSLSYSFLIFFLHSEFSLALSLSLYAPPMALSHSTPRISQNNTSIIFHHFNFVNFFF